MKRALLMFFLVGISLCCMGFSCAGPDQRVTAAMDQRDEAIINYSKNTDKVVEGVLQGYREASLRQVEDFYAQDLRKVASNAGPDGKVDAAKAVQFLLEADQLRQQRRAEVEAQVSKALAAYNDSKRDLVIAQKLNQVLRAHEDAGVDITAAQVAAEQIIEILRPQKK